MVWSLNTKNFKLFGCKCYILKESKNEKFDTKSDEGIFLGYSTISKSYKCLNANTKKVVESANINFDEHAKFQDNASIKKPEEYKSVVYFYEGMPDEEEATNQVRNQQIILLSIESQPVNVELYSDAELQNG